MRKYICKVAAVLTCLVAFAGVALAQASPGAREGGKEVTG
jgi:hypothetical protein